MQVCLGQVKVDTGSGSKLDNRIDKPFPNCLVHRPKRLSAFPFLHFWKVCDIIMLVYIHSLIA
jgi:hypothetical protein